LSAVDSLSDAHGRHKASQSDPASTDAGDDERENRDSFD